MFLIILTIILTSMGLMCAHHYYAVNQRLNVYRSYGYDRGLLFYTGNTWEMLDIIGSGRQNGIDYKEVSRKKADNLLDKVNAFESVDNAFYTSSSTSVLINDGKNGIYLLELPLSGNNPWMLTKGRMPSVDSPNEICISSNFENKYKVGDIISFEIYYGTYKEPENCTLCITGFFDDNAYMPVDVGTTFKYEISTWEGDTIAYAVSSNIITDNNTKVVFNKDYDHIFVVPETGCDMEQLKTQLSKLTSRGKIYDYDDYKKECYNDNKDVNDMIMVFFISTIVLLISVLSSYTIIQTSINKNEILIYYVNGCTWKKAVSISCFATLPTFIVGLISGTVVYKCAPIFCIITNGSYLFDMRLVVLFICLALLLYFALTGAFYFATCRQSVIESLRSE